MLPSDPSENFDRLLAKGKGALKNVGQRLLVHALSITGSILLSGSAWSKLGEDVSWSAASGAFLAYYIGFICLFPRQTERRSEWYLPVGLGLLSCLIGLGSGLPLQSAVLLGGFQVWLQKMFYKKGQSSWDWSVSPFLLIALWQRFFSKGDSQALIFIAAAFLLAAIGVGAQKIWVKLRRSPIFRQKLAASIRSLHAYQNAQRLPASLATSLERLQSQSLLLLNKGVEAEEIDLVLAEDMGLLAERLPKAAQLESNADRVRHASLVIDDLTRRLSVRLSEIGAQGGRRNSEQEKVALRLNAFRQDAYRLADKASHLPPDIRLPLENICVSAASILDCMDKDPRDVAPGERFLTRYLAAAHKVVDEYLNLDDALSSHHRSRELLSRLENAFADQYKNFKENDLFNFNVELNVLDKLLNMDGH